MYGVPADLDLTFLNGAELIQVCLGSHQLQFHFHPVGSIYVDGGWALLGPGGECVDQKDDRPDRPPYQLHRLLGQTVASTEISPPAWFALQFAGGEVLRVFDDSEQYESFQIQPGGVVV
jgi:hypothetical protein